MSDLSEQLLDRPRTVQQLAMISGRSPASVRTWLKSLGSRVKEGLLKPRIYWIDELENARLRGACEHRWRKVSLVTEADGFDIMECELCQRRGKRYGVGKGVVADPPKD